MISDYFNAMKLLKFREVISFRISLAKKTEEKTKQAFGKALFVDELYI